MKDPLRAALAVSGLLGHLVDMVPESNSPDWRVTVDASFKEALAQDEEFQEHVREFQRSPLAFVEHLWWLDDQLVYAQHCANCAAAITTSGNCTQCHPVERRRGPAASTA